MNISCYVYRIAIDPLLRPLRKRLAHMIKPYPNILEVGSGTGAQSLMLAASGHAVTAIDINTVMTQCAKKRAEQAHHPVPEYKNADASNLPEFADKQFDAAAITLALHEMKHEMREAVLTEMLRTANTLIIADYTAPLPRTPIGGFVRLIERLAGAEHFAGFKDFQRRGGLSAVYEKLHLTCISSETVLHGVARIDILRPGTTPTDDSRDSTSQ
ncbi:MAG: class I SAM-dependent methyltransferase [Spirochaetota bacterium]